MSLTKNERGYLKIKQKMTECVAQVVKGPAYQVRGL
jgi:hypothetical protein